MRRRQQRFLNWCSMLWQDALESELNAKVHMLTVSADPRFSLVRCVCYI